ncbi:hypothetical protein BSKO_06907 [Bryopsis sp. KO-2023]|nr:hypothetical protein BSKO_06907 [Bryopsis sp. KO-2023]
MTFSVSQWIVTVVLLARAALETQCAPEKRNVLFGAQQASPDGLISFTSTMFDEYASGKPRSYSVIFMLKAEHLMDKGNLKLNKVLEEFRLASQAYKEKYSKGSRAGQVFFATLEYKDSGHIFERLGVVTLPMIFRMPGKTHVRRTGSIDVAKEDTMVPKTHPNYPWSAETIAEFVKSRTGLAVEEIPRYSITRSPYFVLIVLAGLGVAGMTAYNLYYSAFMQNKWIYIVGTVGVCWFATSGGMFNIIRGVPFAIPARDGSLQLFYPSAGQQLGAEGFMVGTGYLIFSGMVLVMKNVVPKTRSKSMRRMMFYLSLTVALIIFRQIAWAYVTKTGYQMRHYLF